MAPIVLDEAGLSLLGRHADWWQRKASLYAAVQGEPLGRLWLPLADGSTAEEDMDVTPQALDVERLVGEPLALRESVLPARAPEARAPEGRALSARAPGALERNGDLFATAAPYPRIPWMEAILGTPIRATIQGGSMRTRAFIRDWAAWEGGAVHRDPAWFGLLKRMTGLLVERSGGRYAVTQTLMRGPADLAEAVLGPERMCLSMYDHPQSLRRFLDEVTDAFIEVLHGQLERIPPIHGGYVTPFGIWAPGTVARTQCDATAFLSGAQYAEWFRPCDVRISEAVDYAIIHLHSCSLHTVDALLDVERPQAIQVILEEPPVGPTLPQMLPVFRRILAAKPLLLEGRLSEEEVRWLQGELPPGGLAITARRSAW